MTLLAEAQPKTAQSFLRRPPRGVDSPTIRIGSLALMVVAIGMIVSGIVAAIDGGGGEWALVASAALSGAVGIAGWTSTVPPKIVRPISAFSAVAWSWIAISIAGSFPFLFSGTLSGWDDALFESVSGFSCTGSTVIADIDSVANGILFFRSMTQWFGGMGLIVLAVAVLPLLGVGGLDLVAAEAPGPEAESLTPRVSETARRLWIVYGWFTVAVTGALFAAGMSIFDAVTHAFATVSTGGFSPRGASIGFFDSPLIEWLLIVGMIIGGANFALHLAFLRGDRRAHWRVSEFRLYIYILAGGTALISMIITGRNDSIFDTIREAAFNIVTIVTSCGFGTTDFTQWAIPGQIILLLLMIPAAMTGSTSGGFKLLRLQVIIRMAVREMTMVLHPRAVVPIRLGSTTVDERVAARVVGFVVIFFVLMLGGGLLVTALGSDPVTGFSGAVSAISNIGPALGEAGPHSNYLVFTRPARGVLMLLMLFGRLEIFPMIFIFSALGRRVERARMRKIHAQGRVGR